MTGFALILWVYSINQSALAVSLMTFCNYVPYVIVSLFAGAFVDRHSKKKIMLLSDSIAAVSFLAGDLLMGTGRNVWMWSIAALAASFPIPFINAGQNVILYRKVPVEMQGRVFAVRNAIQYSTIPVAILLGGVLADYVSEPFMGKDNAVTGALHMLVGEGSGSGMALMFVCTGIPGSLFSVISCRRKEIRALSMDIR